MIQNTLPLAASSCFKYACSKRRSGIGGSGGRCRFGGEDGAGEDSRDISETNSSSSSSSSSSESISSEGDCLESLWRLAREEENCIDGKASRAILTGGRSAEVAGAISLDGDGWRMI